MISAFFDLVSDKVASAILAMVVASLLPWAVSIIAKVSGGFRVINNAHPRDFFQHTTGMAARANAAQQNSYETLPVFVPQSIINVLAWLYVIIRIGYCTAYITNLSTFRSILWVLSMACCLMLFYLAIRVSV